MSADAVYDRAAMLSMAEEIAALREKVALLEQEKAFAWEIEPDTVATAEWKARAEKAEKERDEARVLLDTWSEGRYRQPEEADLEARIDAEITNKNSTLGNVREEKEGGKK